jgi:hypothetical protein
MDHPTSQIPTTEGHSIVDNHQNLSKKRDRQAFKSKTHLYLQSIYQTLPHHIAQEQHNQQESVYQCSRHHQYNAVALLLLKRNNHKHQWHQPAPRRPLLLLNPYRLVELSTPYLRQLAEEPPVLAGLLLKNEFRQDFSPPYATVEVEEGIHQEAEEVEAEEEAVAV